MMILTSFFFSRLKYLCFGLDSTGVATLHNITGDVVYSTNIYLTFLRNNEVYTYFSNSAGNDFFFIVNLENNSTRELTLDKS